jgi:hypothetical protein
MSTSGEKVRLSFLSTNQSQVSTTQQPAVDPNCVSAAPPSFGTDFLYNEQELPNRNGLADPFKTMPPAQAKLVIGRPNDRYEREADQVASQVVKRINAPVSARPAQGQSVQFRPDPAAQAKPDTTLQGQDRLQAQTGGEGSQRGEAVGGGEASTDLASAIRLGKGSGHSLV